MYSVLPLCFSAPIFVFCSPSPVYVLLFSLLSPLCFPLSRLFFFVLFPLISLPYHPLVLPLPIPSLSIPVLPPRIFTTLLLLSIPPPLLLPSFLKIRPQDLRA